MAKFRSETRLPSLTVSVGLAKRIETWYQNDLPKLRPELCLERTIEYSVAITDGLGTETLDTIDDFGSPRFPDSVESLVFRWHNGYGSPRLEVGISFHAGSLRSTLQTEFTGEGARELTVLIRDAVERLVEPSRNANSFYNPFPSSEYVLPTMGLIVPSIGLIAIVALRGWLAIVIALADFAVVWWCVGGKFNPFVKFDTRAQGRRDGAWKYLSLGLLTFILFGTLLTRFRRAILGF